MLYARAARHPEVIRSFAVMLEKDIAIHERQVFTVLDAFGDVGGLFEGIGYVFAIFYGFLRLLGYDQVT